MGLMMTLFDDEQILKAYLKDIADTTARKTEREIAERMIKVGKRSLEEIASYVPALTLEELKEIETEVKQLA